MHQGAQVLLRVSVGVMMHENTVPTLQRISHIKRGSSHSQTTGAMSAFCLQRCALTPSTNMLSTISPT